MDTTFVSQLKPRPRNITQTSAPPTRDVRHTMGGRPALRAALCLGLLLLMLDTQARGQADAQEKPSVQHRVRVAITDAETQQPLAARLYLQNAQGQSFFFASVAKQGTAIPYNKQNRGNPNSFERHTTVSAHPCEATVPAGRYTLTVERGKEYFPHQTELRVGDDPGQDVEVTVALRRWIKMAKSGWYSGDTHIHRSIDELRNVVLAEDLNVVFPLTDWVTISDTLPSKGDKSQRAERRSELIHVDDTHVIWSRNTEYEIFTVDRRPHTLGALFVLGHQGALQQAVPPWKPVIDAARTADPDVLFDMDKLAWPFAMVLPTLAPDALYELANNHMWRTEFAFRDWYTPTPNFIQPPFGGTAGSERDWIDFTLGMYYVLLDSGFRLPPSAGTANGVHPVPTGFGRVYVHQPDGFDYQQWRKSLRQGRSFVTTGPMLMATADNQDPGHVFVLNGETEIPIQIEVLSEQPLAFGEIMLNGKPAQLLRAQNQRTQTGAYRTQIQTSVKPTDSGWFAIRFWEDRPGGRTRFAHTAPWYVECNGGKVKPRRAERDYLVRRMEDEIERSRGVVSAEALAEYEQALKFYRDLPIADDSASVHRSGRPIANEDDPWLRNMIVDHRFGPLEVRRATAASLEQATAWVDRLGSEPTEHSGLKVLPYPGGRHPRRGFLEGAIEPQRDTKVSIFPPWKDGGYAVVDVPEAIFSNLGLTYLAHTHIPTIWSSKNVELPPVEWQREGQALVTQRELPNGIAFGARVEQVDDRVEMEMWLRNGTDQPLTGLRSQVCVMLSGLRGFTAQRSRQKIIRDSFVAVKADTTDRWLITSWTPLNRAWTNPPVPCIHSDPIFPDCQPGATVTVRGGLWFYEGKEIEKFVRQLATRRADAVQILGGADEKLPL